MPSSPRIFAGAASFSTSCIRRSCVVRASGAVAILIGARCFVEAVAFTCIAAIAHVGTTGTLPLPIVPWSLVLPARDPDGLAVLSRMVAFALIAEGFLWRNLSIARGAVRWNDSRNALLFAGTCVGLAALATGP